MDIAITSQIFSGDIGEVKGDSNKVADELATFTELTWLDDLKPLIDEGHQVNIDIVVDHDTKAVPRRTSIQCSSADLERRVRTLMSSEEVIWERFLEERGK